MVKKFLLLILALGFWPALTAATNFSQTYERLSPLPKNELVCLTPVCDLLTLFLLILSDTLKVIPVFSVLFIIIGGFKMVGAAGNEEKYADAKRTIVWAILGLVVSVLSFAIVAIVQNLLKVNIKNI